MRDSPPDFDVAIVGLGPVGAVAANLCGLLRIRTLVVERDAEPYVMPRAIHFDAEIMRVFQLIGVASEIASITRVIEGSLFLGCDGRPIKHIEVADTLAEQGWPSSRTFYQPEVERILRDRLRRYESVTVRLEHECVDIAGGTGNPMLHVLDRRSMKMRWYSTRFVIGSDGASSVVRKKLGIGLHDLGFEEPWLVIDALLSGPIRWPAQYEISDAVRSHRRSLMVCDPRRPATVIPGPGSHRRWEFMIMPDDPVEDMAAPENVGKLLGEWVNMDELEVVRAAVYRFHGLIAERWRSGGVFLAGDAAHQSPPFFGQGLCHGIRDAANLLWKIRLVLAGISDPVVLDSYELERKAHVTRVVEASIAAGSAVCLTDGVSAVRRDQVFREAEHRRSRPQRLSDVVPQLSGGIVDDRRRAGETVAGMRFPQPPISTPGKDSARLDDLAGYRFSLLACNADLPAMPPEYLQAWSGLGGVRMEIAASERSKVMREDSASIRVVDRTGALARWFRAADADFVVVRPDRHVFGAARGMNEACALIDALRDRLHAGNSFTQSALASSGGFPA